MTTTTIDTPATAVAQHPEQLYSYSAWVHVGPGAEGCEKRETGDCEDAAHFHAWCRLQNDYQHREIRDKALGARARKIRQLRDPEADAWAVLEHDIDTLARAGESAREDIVGDLLSREWAKDYIEAIEDLKETEEPDGGKPFEHVDVDQARYQELLAQPEEERDADAFGSLERHLARYVEALNARVREIQAPRREALDAKDISALIDLVREDRIAAIADEEFDHVYAIFQWLECTATTEHGPRRFATLEAMTSGAPEVIVALKAAYDQLEAARRQGALGKS